MRTILDGRASMSVIEEMVAASATSKRRDLVWGRIH
jgi:hypothetical protein